MHVRGPSAHVRSVKIPVQELDERAPPHVRWVQHVLRNRGRARQQDELTAEIKVVQQGKEADAEPGAESDGCGSAVGAQVTRPEHQDEQSARRKQIGPQNGRGGKEPGGRAAASRGPEYSRFRSAATPRSTPPRAMG